MEWLSTEQRFADIEYNLSRLREEIASAKEKSVSSEPVHLMAVTKTVESVFINHAIDCGIDLIGENKVQEFLQKKPELKLENCKTHLIGHLQTNKVKKIVGEVDIIESVDSVRLAAEIGKRSSELGIKSNVLLEVNVGNEESKFGFMPEELNEKVFEISEIKGIFVRGLMCVAPICDEKVKLRIIFSQIYRSFIDIRSKKIDNISMDFISMGMSADFAEAILEGSNIVRVGSAVFGARNYR